LPILYSGSRGVSRGDMKRSTLSIQMAWLKTACSKSLAIMLTLVCFLCPQPALALSPQQKAVQISLIKHLKSQGETVYAVIPKTSTDPFFKQAGKGCAQAAIDRGFQCIYYGSDQENMRLQVEDILDLITAGIDGIAISAINKDWINQYIAIHR